MTTHYEGSGAEREPPKPPNEDTVVVPPAVLVMVAMKRRLGELVRQQNEMR